MSITESTEKAHRGTWQPLRVTFDTAAERLPQALQDEGFGVITQIDLQQTFKAKLGKDFPALQRSRHGLPRIGWAAVTW